jgi:hypothetical protein
MIPIATTVASATGFCRRIQRLSSGRISRMVTPAGAVRLAVHVLRECLMKADVLSATVHCNEVWPDVTGGGVAQFAGWAMGGRACTPVGGHLPFHPGCRAGLRSALRAIVPGSGTNGGGAIRPPPSNRCRPRPYSFQWPATTWKKVLARRF